MEKQQAMQVLSDFYYNQLGFCGCGNPEDVLLFIKNVLKAIDGRHKTKTDEQFREDISKALSLGTSDVYNMDNNRYGLFLFVLQVLDGRRVLTHGGSIGGAWIDDYGKTLLEAFEVVGDDLEIVFDFE